MNNPQIITIKQYQERFFAPGAAPGRWTVANHCKLGVLPAIRFVENGKWYIDERQLRAGESSD